MYPAIGTNTTGYPSLLDRIGYPRIAVDGTTDIITSIADMLYTPNVASDSLATRTGNLDSYPTVGNFVRKIGSKKGTNSAPDTNSNTILDD